jgi:ribosomal protein S18 acetylase RimI-like enzyme
MYRPTIMAVVSNTISSLAVEKHLRPFDPRQDLAAVADLVELCFAETLDPDGRDYLARMRSASHGSSLQRAAQGWANPAIGGYVWVEDGTVVGNVSLIPYLQNTRRVYLIANVAVHPSFRRRGIARHLTVKAIQYARDRLAPSVWLHVREENQAALSLYESEGFIRRAVRTTWIGVPVSSPMETSPGIHIITPGTSHWRSVGEWFQIGYPAELCWHLPFRIDFLRPGLVGTAFRFLNSANIRQWGIVEEDRLVAAAAWQAAGGHANPVWLAASAMQNEEPVRALLAHLLHHAPSRRNLVLDYPAHQFEGSIQSAGFKVQQTLVWMNLPF